MNMTNKTTRRASFKKIGTGLAALFGIGTVSAMEKPGKDAYGKTKGKKEVVGEIVTDQDIPLFSGAVKHGNTLYIAGKGAHTEPFEIKAHTEIVLQELQKALEANGSSMEKVLKVNVYLADLRDYKAMNEVFRGRFGKNPPVRTTVATYGGVPGNSLVEMDCIAAID
jgi:enamine deaminase RidA (YjgF/YER057c/UK114 family)